MPDKNLLEEFGANDFNERVLGSLVNYKGMYCLTSKEYASKKAIYAQQLVGRELDIRGDLIEIPISFFENLKSLKYPELGYRCADRGQYLAYFSRLPTPLRRGLHIDKFLAANVSNMTKYLREYSGYNVQQFKDPMVLAGLIAYPNFTPLHEGLAKVKAGEILSFVVDNNFAVLPDTKDKYLMIVYRDRIVGHISEKGDITFQTNWAENAWSAVLKAAKDRGNG